MRGVPFAGMHGRAGSIGAMRTGPDHVRLDSIVGLRALQTCLSAEEFATLLAGEELPMSAAVSDPVKTPPAICSTPLSRLQGSSLRGLFSIGGDLPRGMIEALIHQMSIERRNTTIRPFITPWISPIRPASFDGGGIAIGAALLPFFDAPVAIAIGGMSDVPWPISTGHIAELARPVRPWWLRSRRALSVEHLSGYWRRGGRTVPGLAGPDGLDEALVVGFDRVERNIAPCGGMDIVAEAGAQGRFAGVVDHFDRTGLAIDAQPQLVELAGRRTGCLDRPDRASGEIDIHREAVIGIEIIFVDPYRQAPWRRFSAGRNTWATSSPEP